jgi:hypothetical protein
MEPKEAELSVRMKKRHEKGVKGPVFAARCDLPLWKKRQLANEE